jgi:hypothetical protein
LETCGTFASERNHPFVNPACHAISSAIALATAEAYRAKADHPVKNLIPLGQCLEMRPVSAGTIL